MAGKTKSGALAPVEDFVMGIMSNMPVCKSRFMTWASAYFNPMKEFDANKKDSNAGKIIVHLAIAGVVIWAASFIATIISGGMTTAMFMLPGVIVTPIFLVIAAFIGSAILFVIAKVLGAKGGFMEQTLGISLVFGGYTLIDAPLTVLAAIPFIGWAFSLIALLVALYALYSYYRLIKGVHKLSSIKAAIVILLPIVVAIVLAAMLAAALAVMLAGMGLGAMGGMPQMPY